MKYRYFIGHRKPDFPLWKGFEFFKPPPLFSDASPLDQFLADHRLHSEYSSLFQLCDTLATQGITDGQITVAQYRRFVLNIPLGLKSTNLSWVRVLNPADMQDLVIEDEVMPLPGQSYLIGSGCPLPLGMLGNYAGSHYTRDILRFTANLVDADILSNSQAFHFLNQPILIPSPSCGTFPLAKFLRMIGVLKKALIAFYQGGYKSYDHPYQGRVCGFLIERLNSYLLLKELSDANLNMQTVMGSMTMVSESLEVPIGMMAKYLEND